MSSLFVRWTRAALFVWTGNGGHMQLKLLKAQGSPPEDGPTAAPGSGTPDSRRGAAGARIPGSGGGGSAGGGSEGSTAPETPPAVLYGDTCEMVAKKMRPRREGVIRAPVTHFRRRHQVQLGGYLRSDGKGKPCTFTIHHAPPRISMVRRFSLPSGSFFFFFCVSKGGAKCACSRRVEDEAFLSG